MTANLLLATTQKYPPPGSPQATVLQLLIARREKNRMSEVRLMALAATRPESLNESWKEYVQQAFPWTLVAVKREAEEAKAALEKAVPLMVTPLPTTSDILRSRLNAQRVQEYRSRKPKPR